METPHRRRTEAIDGVAPEEWEELESLTEYIGYTTVSHYRHDVLVIGGYNKEELT